MLILSVDIYLPYLWRDWDCMVAEAGPYACNCAGVKANPLTVRLWEREAAKPEGIPSGTWMYKLSSIDPSLNE